MVLLANAVATAGIHGLVAPVWDRGDAHAAATGLARAAISVLGAGRRCYVARLRLARQPKAGQHHAGDADAELLQRRAARDRLGQPFGQFIELVVHNFILFWFGLGRSSDDGFHPVSWLQAEAAPRARLVHCNI